METYAGCLLGDLPTEASYGILSIGAYLKKFGYKVKLIDFHLVDLLLRREHCRGIEEKDIVEILSKSKSKFYGLTVLTISEKWSNIITNLIKDLWCDVHVIWGGYFPTKNDEFILKMNRNIDFIVRNEGELIVRELLDNFTSSGAESLLNLKGISYIQNDTIIRNEDTMPIENLDELPFIDLSLYDKKFRNIIIPRIYSARGCNNKCLYCTADNSVYRKYRKRKPKLVVDEIAYTKEQYGKFFFVMGDLEFLNDPHHAKEICKEIIKRNLDVKWWCQVFPPNITEEIVSLMKEAGNIQIALGIENHNSKSLKSMNKEMSSNSTLNAISIINKYSIQIQAYIMLGLPGETLDTSLETIKYVGKLLDKQFIDVVHFSIMVPYPGSPLHNKDENIKILETDPNKYYMNCDLWGSGIPPYETKHMTQFEIYSIWLLAIAHTQKFFKKNKKYRKYYQSIYYELGIITKKEAENGTL
jgi:radical SAM superfamily enzyme YgiQ (UPF0313 family)